MNTYKAFGLSIASDYVLDELVACQCEKPELMIINGTVPDSFEDIRVDKPNRKIGKDKFLLKVPRVARYYVEKGALIIIEPCELSSLEEIKLYLLGSCMGATLFQRKILPLHGSCINIGGHGVLVTGKSGAGKSTIASAIYKKGYKMLTDDVAAVGVDGFTEPTVYPGYPGQKLWEDAIERIGRRGDKKSLNRISNDCMKYSLKSSANFCDMELPIKAIFEIVPDVVEQMMIEEVKSTDKLNLIMENTYRPMLAKAMQLQEWHFKQCVEIANQVTAYRITRPQGQYLEHKIADIILEKML